MSLIALSKEKFHRCKGRFGNLTQIGVVEITIARVKGGSPRFHEESWAFPKPRSWIFNDLSIFCSIKINNKESPCKGLDRGIFKDKWLPYLSDPLVQINQAWLESIKPTNQCIYQFFLLLWWILWPRVQWELGLPKQFEQSFHYGPPRWKRRSQGRRPKLKQDGWRLVLLWWLVKLPE